MKSEIIYFDATKLAELIRIREISPVEVVQAHLDRIEAVNPKINAVVTVAEGALPAARAAEDAIISGKEVGPLHGVPFSVKDSIDTAGVLTRTPVRLSRVLVCRWSRSTFRLSSATSPSTCSIDCT